MSTTRLEAAISELSKKVAALTTGVASQAAIIEAQNKKIEEQKQIIENYFSTITDLKKVIEEMPANIIEVWQDTMSKSKTTLPADIPAAPSASETEITSEAQIKVSKRALRALKRADKAQSTRRVSNAVVEAVNQNEKSEEWTLVQKKSRRSLMKPVQTGGNAKIDTIQAIQKKKFLHVWSLHPDTSEKAMLDHVKNICESEDIKVEKIIPKTNRDYSSFMIGVPETEFDKLNVADSWPINTRFNEWVWFRNTRKSATIHTTQG